MMYSDGRFKVQEGITDIRKVKMYLKALCECMGYDQEMKYALEDLADRLGDSIELIEKNIPAIFDDISVDDIDEP